MINLHLPIHLLHLSLFYIQENKQEKSSKASQDVSSCTKTLRSLTGSSIY